MKKNLFDLITLVIFAYILVFVIDYNNLGIIQYIFFGIASLAVIAMIINWINDYRLKRIEREK